MPDVRVTPQPWLWRPRTKPIRFIEIHATRGSTTPAAQKLAALNWVRSSQNDQGGWGSSFSYVIGTDGSMGTVLDDNQMPTYSAGYGGQGSTYAIDEYGISYELAQSAALEPFTDACLRRAAKEIAAKCQQHDIPAVFLTIPNQSGVVPTGLVRHDRCQNGYVLGKTDPGDRFDEAEFLTLMRKEGEDMTRLVKAPDGRLWLVNGIFKNCIPSGSGRQNDARKLFGQEVRVGRAFLSDLLTLCDIATDADVKRIVRRELDRTKLKGS